MDNLIRIKQIIDHITKEPFYPTTHAIGVGYTNKNGECITVQEALDNLKNAYEILSEYHLTLGYGNNQAFPGNEGKDLIDAFADLSNQYVNKEQFNEGLSTKQDTLESGENIKTINKESLLIDENTSEDKKNLSLSNSDEANSNEENTSQSIKYKALAQGEEQMLVLKSMGPDFDTLELPSIYDPNHPYTTNLKQYDLNDDDKINYTELSMLYTFVYGNQGNQNREEDTQTDFPNPIYDEGNGFKYTYRREEIIDGNNTRYKLFLYKSENDGPWEKVEGKTLDMSAYTAEIHTSGIEDAEELEDGELTSADITALYNIIYYIAQSNNVQQGSQDFEGENTIFAIFDPNAPNNKKIKIGYNFLKYIKDKDPNYILFECTPSKNVIYCNSFTGKLYRWSTSPTSTMLELYADSYSRNNIKILSNQINTLLNQVNDLSNTKQDTLESGINIKTINNKSIFLSPSDTQTNFSLSNSDNINLNSINYRALAQGEEQMLVLRYIDIKDLPTIQTDASNEMYDYNNDGKLGFFEILLLYKILTEIFPYEESADLSTLTPTTLDSKYHTEGVNAFNDTMSFAYTSEGNKYFLWIAVFDTNNNAWGYYEKQQEQKDGEMVPSKILDVSGDNLITVSDATALYNIMLDNSESETIPTDTESFYEFIGADKIFAAYENKGTLGLTQNRIIIGYDFFHFLQERDRNVPFQENPYVIKILKPSPNVIYCDCNTNNLYRYISINSRNGRMELIYHNKTAAKIQQLQNHIQVLENYVESQGGEIYQADLGDPINVDNH